MERCNARHLPSVTIGRLSTESSLPRANMNIRQYAVVQAILFVLPLNLTLVATCVQLSAQPISVPTVTDPNLELSLLASEPQIVTPTGLTADQRGRLFVVEAHTHARKRDYAGPAGDRILMFDDTNEDGLLDRPQVFADGLRNALAIAFSGDGDLYVVQMKSVVVLKDEDGDGKSDTRQPILTVETDNNNHHGVLLGLAFDNENRAHISLGNIGGSAYSIVGSDRTAVTGQGDTGLIIRCRADGSNVERFAQGFWNPPELKFDLAGRLLVTDNDPDARGPNRVLHVIQGGRYGYQARFGGSGLHPYCAWNGELAGTLPMLAGVGEAPVGLLVCSTSALPAEYANDLLVSVWGTNEVVRVHTRRQGTSLVGEVEPLVVGDVHFRPTSITTTTDGTVYIADWADRRYPVHGKGRIWRLATKTGVRSLRPKSPFSKINSDPAELRLRRLRNAHSGGDFHQLVAAATNHDPFLASTAISTLGKPEFRDQVVELCKADRVSHRLAALLSLRQAGAELSAPQLERLLTDEASDIRKLTMIWLGETMRLDLAESLRASMTLQAESASLFEVFMATSQLLTPEEVARVQAGERGSRIDRSVDQELVLSVLSDAKVSPAAKAMAVRYLTKTNRPDSRRILTELAAAEDVSLAKQAVRTLANSDEASVSRLLARIARDTTKDESLRCEAIMSYAATDTRGPDILLPLVTSKLAPVSLTAIRALTRQVANPSVRDAFTSALERQTLPQQVANQLRFALNVSGAQRPRTDSEWKRRLSEGGDPEAGRRVFFDPRVNCAKCHSVHGRGGRIGPGLSNIAAAKRRSEILDSILSPSSSKSPDYQGYLVTMQDGRTITGTQFHFRGESAELLSEDGTHVRFELRETEDYHPLDVSLMPEDLETNMSVSEFRDLMAYLARLGI